MILFLRFRRATLLLTRGMSRSLYHQQPLEAGFVGLGHHRGLAQVALPLGVLLGQDVALVRVVATQPTRSRQLDPLAERTLRLLLGHFVLRDPRGTAPGLVYPHGLRVFAPTSAPAPSTYCGP